MFADLVNSLGVGLKCSDLNISEKIFWMFEKLEIFKKNVTQLST